MSRQLWRPTIESDGIPFDVLCSIVTNLNEWRDEHLPRVGVPSNFESEWDFVSAVSACASDATYHVMWVILFNAVDDFGIKEVNEVSRMNGVAQAQPNYAAIESVKRKILDEALHGSLRIAGLVRGQYCCKISLFELQMIIVVQCHMRCRLLRHV